VGENREEARISHLQHSRALGSKLGSRICGITGSLMLGTYCKKKAGIDTANYWKLYQK